MTLERAETMPKSSPVHLGHVQSLTGTQHNPLYPYKQANDILTQLPLAAWHLMNNLTIRVHDSVHILTMS